MDASARRRRRSRASTWASSAPGLGGLCAAIRLEQAGIPYTVFDKNADVGGTWFENTYPDLRVDVPNHFYSYSFGPTPTGRTTTPAATSSLDYIATLREGARRPAARPVRHRGASRPTYDDARGTWTCGVRDADGVERDVEVNALDQRGRDAQPSVGPRHRGPRLVRGPVVPLVALGPRRRPARASGSRWSAPARARCSSCPPSRPRSSTLTIFQRSRHWVTPNPDYHRPVTDGEKWLFRHVPLLRWRGTGSCSSGTAPTACIRRSGSTPTGPTPTCRSAGRTTSCAAS